MRYLLILLVSFVLTGLAAAQEDADDKSYLEGWLQDALSDAGRDVTITGFKGALSSNAALEEMTISDDEGVWLTLRDAELIWQRSALFGGALNITRIAVAEIEISRLPSAHQGLDTSDATARPFSLPELPVSIEIGDIEAAEIILGPDVLGEPATLALSGNISLSDGDGAALLNVERTDRADLLKFDGGFSNATRGLRIDLDFIEAEGGLISRLLAIPGAPALGLQIKGDAPISDFTAETTLSSNGQPRFAGQVGIARDAQADDGYLFSADLDGDVRPLFSPDLHPFFGQNSSLVLRGKTLDDGALTLEKLLLRSGALAVDGTLELASDRLPRAFELQGRIGNGSRLRLPVTGPETAISSAEFNATFDAAAGDNWTVTTKISDFARDGLAISEARLEGAGAIRTGVSDSISGDLNFDLDAIRLTDTSLQEAIGTSAKGHLQFLWDASQPLKVKKLEVSSGTLRLDAEGHIDQLSQGLPARGTAVLVAPDLSRFSTLAGRDLTGSARISANGETVLLGGAFDAEIVANTQGLSIGAQQLDSLWRRPTRLNLSAARDADGTKLRKLQIKNDQADILVMGSLTPATATLNINTALQNVSLIEPRLSGPAEASAQFDWKAGAPITLTTLAASLGQTVLEGKGQLWPDQPLLPVQGEVQIRSKDLSHFAGIAGRPLAGRINVDLNGSGELRGKNLAASFDLDGVDVRLGVAPLDPLITGPTEASGRIAMSEASLDLHYLQLDTPRLKINAAGNGLGEPINVSARLSDLALLTPGISGPVATRGTLTIRDRLAKQVQINLNATGPGGITGRLAGEVLEHGQRLSLKTQGQTPLQLANRFIQPRSIIGVADFNLAIDGPARLSSLSGTASFNDARLSLPTLGYRLSDLDGGIRFENNRAQVQLSGTTGTSGQFQLSGPVSLTAPYPADLSVRLLGLGLTDYQLYQTVVNSNMSIRGALLGGAQIGGAISLGKTELRVPSGSGVIIGTLPELRHANEPRDVALTRQRAGLIQRTQTRPASFPLDLTINAPNQIFVRGRGLDAELGGSMRLTGNTTDVRASGVFELIRGRLDILGKRLTLTSGLIDLRGPLDPYLRFVAETAADDVMVRVILEGLASEPEVRFTSDPDLPQEEVVARLLFGRELGSISPFQAAQLVSAVATLSGRYSGGLTGTLRETLGLSDLDITTSNNGATQLRAGAYISDNIYSEITADSDGKQQINLNLDVSETVTVRGRADNQGDTAIGIFFEKDY